MPLTAQARRLLDRFAAAGVEPFDRMSVLQARATVEAARRLQGEPEDVAAVEDVLAGGALPVRIYHPVRAQPGPWIVYLHGGGFVTGSVAVADTPCRALANATGRVVASVEYRLSPETPYPGPAEDCYAATRWLAELGEGPPVLCGDSAGGNLAAAVTLMARDRGGPEIARQVLMYPTLAPTGRGAGGDGLTRAELDWFWAHYLRDGDGPYAAPLLAADLSGLPPALIIAGEYDVLRDEGLAYAERLPQAETLVYPGMIHGFFWMARALDAGRDVCQAIARWL
jgi:acetyl esterase